MKAKILQNIKTVQNKKTSELMDSAVKAAEFDPEFHYCLLVKNVKLKNF